MFFLWGRQAVHFYHKSLTSRSLNIWSTTYTSLISYQRKLRCSPVCHRVFKGKWKNKSSREQKFPELTELEIGCFTTIWTPIIHQYGPINRKPRADGRDTTQIHSLAFDLETITAFGSFIVLPSSTMDNEMQPAEWVHSRETRERFPLQKSSLRLKYSECLFQWRFPDKDLPILRSRDILHHGQEAWLLRTLNPDCIFWCCLKCCKK